MVDKRDLRRLALALDGVEEQGAGSYTFRRDGRLMCWPYPERVHPKKARVSRYDQFVMRVADADDKDAYLLGEPDVFFTTDHYNGYAAVMVRLDAIDESRLAELVAEAWEAAPLSSRLKRNIQQPTGSA
jgi:hypothetical protein